MKCANCGAEVTGKRFCPKCGMPMVDYKAKAKEDEEISLKDLGKRIRELQPTVEAHDRKKEEEKEKKRKEKEEREAELKRLLESEEDEEELGGPFDDDDDDEDFCDDDVEETEEEEETSGRVEEVDDSDLDDDEEPTTHRHSCGRARKSRYVPPLDDEEEILSEETFSGEDDEFEAEREYAESDGSAAATVKISELFYQMSAYCDEMIKIKGECCFSTNIGDVYTFNLDDEEDSIACVVDLTDVTEVTKDDMSFEKDEIASIVSSIKRGDPLIVEGIVHENENGEPEMEVYSIEGEDFIVYCK